MGFVVLIYIERLRGYRAGNGSSDISKIYPPLDAACSGGVCSGARQGQGIKPRSNTYLSLDLVSSLVSSLFHASYCAPIRIPNTPPYYSQDQPPLTTCNGRTNSETATCTPKNHQKRRSLREHCERCTRSANPDFFVAQPAETCSRGRCCLGKATKLPKPPGISSLPL